MEAESKGRMSQARNPGTPDGGFCFTQVTVPEADETALATAVNVRGLPVRPLEDAVTVFVPALGPKVNVADANP